MGYYSRMATGLTEHNSCQPDFLLPCEGDSLALRLAHLQVRLEELEAIRPHDPMHPLYDRYFYTDFVCDEFPNTAQGLLQAIAEVKEKLARRDTLWLEKQHTLTSIRNTGTDQNGQFVFATFFLLECSLCA